MNVQSGAVAELRRQNAARTILWRFLKPDTAVIEKEAGAEAEFQILQVSPKPRHVIHAKITHRQNGEPQLGAGENQVLAFVFKKVGFVAQCGDGARLNSVVFISV